MSPPKDAEAAVAPCLAITRQGQSLQGSHGDSLEMSSVLTFVRDWIFKTFPLCCWLVPVYPGSSSSTVEKDCCPKVSQASWEFKNNLKLQDAWLSLCNKMESYSLPGLGGGLDCET